MTGVVILALAQQVPMIRNNVAPALHPFPGYYDKVSVLSKQVAEARHPGLIPARGKRGEDILNRLFV
jgi:hypothetical protein